MRPLSTSGDPTPEPEPDPTHSPRATIDFETASACDIRVHGAWVYSRHPSTRLMCLAVRLPYWEPGRCELWHPAFPELEWDEEGREHLEELFAWIEAGGLVEAHNVGFERAVWENLCLALGWPPVDRLQWRCSAAKAARHAIPRSLEGAGAALGLAVQKDDEGKKVMLKVCKPRKARKAEREAMLRAWADGAGPHPDRVTLWHWDRDLFLRLFAYCRRDVLAEEALSEALPDLSEDEQRVWLADQDMNHRGVLVDMELASSALWIAERYCRGCRLELADLMGLPTDLDRNGDRAHMPTRLKLLDWVRTRGVALPDTQGATLAKFRKLVGLPDDVRRAMDIWQEVNRTSTAKYQTMLDCADESGVIRDLMMYHGSSTGRWAGKGLQPHNFPKGKLASDLAMATAVEAIKSRDVDLVRALYGENVMEVLSWALRGAIMAPDGYELLVADFSAIEARVVLWLAGEEEALRVFERGDCIYCHMATGIYGYSVRKGIEKDERQFGKQAILGLGFEMGFVKFLVTCRKYDIVFTERQCRAIVGEDYALHEEKIRDYFGSVPTRLRTLEAADLDLEAVMHELVLMRYTVMTYRSRYPAVPQMWRDLETAAIAAVESPGRETSCAGGKIRWRVEGRFLKCYLPSGRPLHYSDPKVVKRYAPWDVDRRGKPKAGAQRRPTLTFMGVNAKTKQWCRKEAYGGLLAENATQATARDLMAEAMVRGDDDPRLDVLLSVHDELICQAVVGSVTVGEFERMMAFVPYWARGCPIDAEGWAGKRYRK